MIGNTTDTAKAAAQALTKTFLREYRWSVLMLCTSALMLGFSFGVVWQHWRAAPEPPSAITNIPVVSQAKRENDAASVNPHHNAPRSQSRPAHETSK